MNDEELRLRAIELARVHSKWTDGRQALIAQQCVAGIPMHAILTALNDLPGKKVTSPQLQGYCRRMGIRSPAASASA